MICFDIREIDNYPAAAGRQYTRGGLMLKYAGHVTNDYALDFEITKLSNEAWAQEMQKMIQSLTGDMPDEDVSSYVFDHKKETYDVLKYYDILPANTTSNAAVDYFSLLYAAIRSKHLLVPDMYMYYIIHRLASNIERLSNSNNMSSEELEKMHLRLPQKTREMVLEKMNLDCKDNLGDSIPNATISCEELLKSIETQKYLDIFLPDWDFLMLDEINTAVEVLPAKVPKHWYTKTDFFYEYSNPMVGECIQM